MAATEIEIAEIHWLMDMLQSIDVGLTVVDRAGRVCVWNRFMENYSGLSPAEIMGRDLCERFPEIPRDWFRQRLESVFLLGRRAFTAWDQRPFLIRFKSNRPITGETEFMYQNVTLVPLSSSDGSIGHVGIIIYDATEAAVGRLGLERANSQLETLSRTDPLTGLNNRGHWEDCLEAEFARFARTLHPVSLVMLDIDHFKAINDGHGHQAGDEVIRALAQAVRAAVRVTDVAGRYGGEEFGIILVNTDGEGAAVVAERLRERIEDTVVSWRGQTIRFTVSLGVAEAEPEMSDSAEWLGRADAALYQAKAQGRNQVVLHPSS